MKRGFCIEIISWRINSYTRLIEHIFSTSSTVIRTERFLREVDLRPIFSKLFFQKVSLWSYDGSVLFNMCPTGYVNVWRKFFSGIELNERIIFMIRFVWYIESSLSMLIYYPKKLLTSISSQVIIKQKVCWAYPRNVYIYLTCIRGSLPLSTDLLYENGWH